MFFFKGFLQEEQTIQFECFLEALIFVTSVNDVSFEKRWHNFLFFLGSFCRERSSKPSLCMFFSLLPILDWPKMSKTSSIVTPIDNICSFRTHISLLLRAWIFPWTAWTQLFLLQESYLIEIWRIWFFCAGIVMVQDCQKWYYFKHISFFKLSSITIGFASSIKLMFDRFWSAEGLRIELFDSRTMKKFFMIGQGCRELQWLLSLYQSSKGKFPEVFLRYNTGCENALIFILA